MRDGIKSYRSLICFMMLFAVVLTSCCPRCCDDYGSGDSWGWGSSSGYEEDSSYSDEAPGITEEQINYYVVPETRHSVQKVLAYLRHVKHLRLENSCVYYNPTLRVLSMEFTSQDILETREGRFLLVDLVEALLTEFNNNPILSATFNGYPLTAENLDIYIDFESFEGIYTDPYYVGEIDLQENQVFYYAFDTKHLDRDLWNFRHETYPNALSLAIYEREAEALFKQTVELAVPDSLKIEQYRSPDKVIPRYYSPYEQKNKLFE